MKKKLVLKYFLLILFLASLTIIYINKNKQSKEISKVEMQDEIETYTSSNIMKDVSYTSKDINGNEYIIKASEGQIDISDSSTIFLSDVRALIKLKNSNNIEINSDFGKYNINNFDTIFSKNVIITYLDNKITSDYLDFSMKRNSLIISKNIIYTNNENVLNADVVEINIQTKDTKILMYEDKKKVNIRNKK